MIDWTVERGVAFGMLDRPERRNALDADTVAELTELLAAGKGPALPVVLAGAGTTFCSGFDLTTRSEGATFKLHANRLFSAILAYPAPVIAALNGPAVGMGVVLAAMCDLRIGCEHAWLEIPAARLDVILDDGYVHNLRDRLGVAVAQLLFVASRRIDGRQAAELGAVHALADDPVAEAKAWAAHAASLSPASIAVHKTFVNQTRASRRSDGTGQAL